MPNEIFVNKRFETPDNTYTDVFVGVATPAELADLNTVSPAQGSIFFRTSTVNLMCNSLDYANQVYNDIVSEVNQLVQDLNALDVLAVQNVDVIS